MGKSSPSDFIINEPCLPKLHERSILFKSENQLEFWYRDIDRQQFDEQEIVRISNLLKFIKPSNAICPAGLPPTIDASNAASSNRRYWFHAGTAFDRTPIAYLPHHTPKEIIEDALGCLALMHDANLVHGAICSDTVYLVPKPVGLECRPRLAIFCDPVAISAYKSVNVQDSPLLETARIGDGMPTAFQDVVSLILLFSEAIIPGEVPRKDRKVDLRQLQQVLSSKNKKDEDPFTEKLISLIETTIRVPKRRRHSWSASNARVALQRCEARNDPMVLWRSRWPFYSIVSLLLAGGLGTILFWKRGIDLSKRSAELTALKIANTELKSEKKSQSIFEKKDPSLTSRQLAELTEAWKQETEKTPLSTCAEILAALDQFAKKTQGVPYGKEKLAIVLERKTLFEKELQGLEFWEEADNLLKADTLKSKRTSLINDMWNEDKVNQLKSRFEICKNAYAFWKNELVTKRDLKSLDSASDFVSNKAILDLPTKALLQAWIDYQKKLNAIKIYCDNDKTYIQIRVGGSGWSELKQSSASGVEFKIHSDLNPDFELYARYSNWNVWPSANRRKEPGVFGLWKFLDGKSIDLPPFGKIKVEPMGPIYPPIKQHFDSGSIVAPDIESEPNRERNQNQMKPATGSVPIGLGDLNNQ